MINTSSYSQFDAGTHLSFFSSLRGKLSSLFLAVSLIPLITVGILAYTQAKNALNFEVINKLIAVRDIKAQRITEYFNERLSDVKVFSQNPSTKAAIRTFEKTVHTDQQVLGTDEIGVMNHYRSLYLGQPELAQVDDDSAYSIAHAQYHPMFKAYKEAYGYYDIFLVEPHTGTIVYTVVKEDDFGTSLQNGPYADTNIGQIFQDTVVATQQNVTRLEDFAYYESSQEEASFIASPIFDNSQLIGVLIFQLSTAQINAIMQERTGLGKTGETILISSDDFLLRSDSRFFAESTLLKQKVHTEATRASAIGETGVKAIIDYRGEPTIIAHTPLNIPNVKWSLNAKIDQAEAFTAAQQMLLWMLTIIGIGSMIVVGVAIWVGNSISRPVWVMTDVARQLAAGNLNLTVEVKQQGEIGVMADAFRQMIVNMRLVIEDIVQLSQGLAAGKLYIRPKTEYKGDFIQIKNALETALSNLRLVIKDIDHISRELAEGNWQIMPGTEYRGEFVQIKNALTSTAIKLEKTTAKNTEQNWLKTGQNQLNGQLSGEQEIVQLAENAINFITPYVKAQVGALYLFEQAEQSSGSLKMMATYAYSGQVKANHEFQLGEGIVGQVASEQQTIIMTHPPENYLEIQSGLGSATPYTIIAMPFLYEGTLKGVIELASFTAFTELQLEFLHQVMPTIAITINSAQSRQQMQELLQRIQTQY